MRSSSWSGVWAKMLWVASNKQLNFDWSVSESGFIGLFYQSIPGRHDLIWVPGLALWDFLNSDSVC